MPASRCRSTDLLHGAADPRGEGVLVDRDPVAFAHIAWIRSSGRGRLPVCVVRMRSSSIGFLVVSGFRRVGIA